MRYCPFRTGDLDECGKWCALYMDDSACCAIGLIARVIEFEAEDARLAKVRRMHEEAKKG